MNFRTDINGLRAIAVIAVVLFHFNPEWMPGGFAGVDVFFVISGFLMTGIIFKGLENNTFNIFKFYVARANRIIPALAMLCLFLLLFGWFYLVPIDYSQLGRHVVGSVSFLSNFVYWSESSYFDAVSTEKWLLHTWSLSVEWQFYIIYPVILVILKKALSLCTIKKLIVLGLFVGLIFSAIFTVISPNAAYYLLPTRAWEMMFGGIAYLYPIKLKYNQKRSVELFGFILILFSYIFISKDTPWPSYFALLPVIGTFLVIIANRQESILTNNVIFQSVGKWSYSIYLWHWPIVVWGYYFHIDNWWHIGIVLSVVVGYISYRYIESIRFSSFHSISSLLKVKPLLIATVVGGIGLMIVLDSGADRRSESSLITYESLLKKTRPNVGLSSKCQSDETLFIDDSCYTSKEPEILAWGDSFVMHLIPGIINAVPDAKLIQLTKHSCAPFLDITRVRSSTNLTFPNKCMQFNDDVKNWLQKNESVKYVILSSPFYPLFETDAIGLHRDKGIIKLSKDIIDYEFRKTLDYIISLGKEVIVFSNLPRTGNNHAKCLSQAEFFSKPLASCDFSLEDLTSEDKAVYTWLSQVNNDYEVILFQDYLCKDGKCKASIDSSYIYRDWGHLSYEGASLLGKYMDFKSIIYN